jgi:hypothetical protein
VWDDPTRLWDATTPAGWVDAVCDFHALSIDPGDPDELGIFPASALTVTLDNRDGTWAVWTADGRLDRWAPGRRIAVWAHLDGADWWLYAGRIAAWDVNADETVTLTAYDGIAELAQPLPAGWTPGTAGERPLQRIRAIAGQAAYAGTVDGDPGDVTLATVAEESQAPLDAIHRAALSDGGVFHGDNDGRVTYRSRTWRNGRPDQSVVRTFTDNVCQAGALVVWEPDLEANDDGLYTTVQLVNLAAVTATATLPPTGWAEGVVLRLTHPDPDLWQTAAAGDRLAADLLAAQSTPALRIRSFVLHLLAPQQDLWLAAIDLRRGDRIEWISDYTTPTGPARLDVLAVVVGVRHDITPDSWQATVSTTRAVGFVTPLYWDQSPYVWDDPNPANVWRW